MEIGEYQEAVKRTANNKLSDREQFFDYSMTSKRSQ